MTNEQNRFSPHKQLENAVMALVKALMVQKEARWASSEEEEIVGGEVAAAWDSVHTQLVEIEWAGEARGEAKALTQAMFYMERFKKVVFDEFDRRELSEIVSPDNPSWYNPED